MNVLRYILFAVLLKTIAVCGNKGICTDLENYTALETYYRDVNRLITYQGFWPWSRKSKWITERSPANKIVYKTRSVYTCCRGYSGRYPYCQPICNSGCINGICTEPNVCTCHKGYEKTLVNRHICKPVCLRGCEHGICSAPNKCTCLKGYIKDENDHCIPICNGGCPFGKCVAPDKCECKPGYNMNRIGTYCEPICLDACENGICSAPNECTCLKGYKKDENDHCIPICKDGCPFGMCVASDKCECNPGYNMNRIGTYCEPICLDGCVNGICAAPNECTCLKGYKKYENDHCIPICNGGCPFGKCVAPDKCECQPGYTLTSSAIGCEPKCSDGCDHGFCYRPEMCVCNQGYLMGSKNKCEPICSHGCINGVCIEPEMCSCLPGFQMPTNSVNQCEPICEPECQNSDCIEPGMCRCWMDFIPVNRTSCEPYCPKCFNGYCAEPNNCTCNEGYEAHDYEPNVCSPICDDCQYGDCISPGHCLCWPGFEMSKNNMCRLATETTDISRILEYTAELTEMTTESSPSTSLSTHFEFSELSSTYIETSSESKFSDPPSTFVETSSETDPTTSSLSSSFSDATTVPVSAFNNYLSSKADKVQTNKVSLCNCWVLSFAAFNSSHPGECVPNCNATLQASCINPDTCEVDKDRQELTCNGTVYTCRPNMPNASTGVTTVLLWILGIVFVIASALGIWFIRERYRYHGSRILNADDLQMQCVE